MDIPVIDIGPLVTDSEDNTKIMQVANQIGEACIHVGFFYVINHGIPKQKLELMILEAERFFLMDKQRKMKINISKSLNHRGYFGVGEENVDETRTDGGDLKEGIDIGLELPEDDEDILKQTPNYGPNQWPEELSDSTTPISILSWKKNILDFFDELLVLGRRILKAFAIHLELPEYYFENMFKKPMALLRFLNYPPSIHKTTSTQLGCGEHTDYGFLTLLLQDSIGGLQIQNSEGKWIDAIPIEGSFVVNIGDMMARITNDKFKATRHRVINNHTTKNRISIPFFFDPHYNTKAECLASCQSQNNPSKYPPVIYGDHLIQRLNATFSYRQTLEEVM